MGVAGTLAPGRVAHSTPIATTNGSVNGSSVRLMAIVASPATPLEKISEGGPQLIGS